MRELARVSSATVGAWRISERQVGIRWPSTLSIIVQTFVCRVQISVFWQSQSQGVCWRRIYVIKAPNFAGELGCAFFGVCTNEFTALWRSAALICEISSSMMQFLRRNLLFQYYNDAALSLASRSSVNATSVMTSFGYSLVGPRADLFPAGKI